MLIPGRYPAVTLRTSTTGTPVGVTTGPEVALAFVIEQLLDILDVFDCFVAVFADVLVVMLAEVGVDDGGVAHDLVGIAFRDDTTFGHHDDPVGDVAHHLHVVLHKQHGHAPVSYTHLRAHETDSYLVCRL